MRFDFREKLMSFYIGPTDPDGNTPILQKLTVGEKYIGWMISKTDAEFVCAAFNAPPDLDGPIIVASPEKFEPVADGWHKADTETQAEFEAFVKSRGGNIHDKGKK